MQALHWLMLLAVMVIGSAMTVVYVKHESRMLFSELRDVHEEQDRQVMRWSRLQLQNSTLITQSNVEAVARRKLHMVLPEQVQIVTLDSHGR